MSKFGFAFAALLAMAGCAGAPTAAPVAPTGDAAPAYGVEKIKSIAVDHKIREGNFIMVVLPRTTEVDIALTFPSWEEKHVAPAERVAKAKEIAQRHEGKMMAVLDVVFAGDAGDEERRIPGDLAQQIFLENERGERVPCTSATLPLAHAINATTREVKIEIEFSNLVAPNGRNVLDGAHELRFVVGGLGFKEQTIRYEAPFTSLFSDAPRELRDLFPSSQGS